MTNSLAVARPAKATKESFANGTPRPKLTAKGLEARKKWDNYFSQLSWDYNEMIERNMYSEAAYRRECAEQGIVCEEM